MLEGRRIKLFFLKGDDFSYQAVVKNPSANAGDRRDVGSVARSGRSPGVGNGNPLLYSCLENSKDRGAWQAIVYEVARSLSTCTHT